MTQKTQRRPREIRSRLATILLAALTSAILAITACGGDSQSQERIRIVALTPQSATAGATTDVTVSLHKGGMPFDSNLTIEMLKQSEGGAPSLKHRDLVEGTKTITLVMPSEPGTYRIRFSGTDGRGSTFDESGSIRLEDTSFVILQTDKPTYQPGHDLHMRAILMNRELKPVRGNVTFLVQDAKGASVHQERIQTGPYGMATSSMPISQEPRTGTWKVTATATRKSDSKEVLVDHYILPRYRVEVAPAKKQVGSGDPIEGSINTQYTYGLPAKGTLLIAPMYRETGKSDWVEGRFQTVNTQGEYEYSFETAEKWNGEVRVDVLFKEGHGDEGTVAQGTHRVTHAKSDLQIIPDGNTVRPGLPFRFEIRETEWSEKHGEREVQYTLEYTNREMRDNTVRKNEDLTMKQGRAQVRMDVPKNASTVTLKVKDWKDRETIAHLSASHSNTGRYIQIEDQQPGKREPGDIIRFKVHATFDPEIVYWQALSKGRVTKAGTTEEDEFQVEVDGRMSPMTRVVAYVLTKEGELITSQTDIEIEDAFPLRTQAKILPEHPRPGDMVAISVETDGPSLVSVAGADRATHVLAGSELDLSKLLLSLNVPLGSKWDQEAMVRQHRGRQDRIANPGSSQLMDGNRIQMISNVEKQIGRTLLGSGVKEKASWAGKSNTFIEEILTAPWRRSFWQESGQNRAATGSALIVGIVILTGTGGTILAIVFQRIRRNAARRRLEGRRASGMAKAFLAIGILAALLAAAAFILPGITSRLIVEPAGGQSVSGDSVGEGYSGRSAPGPATTEESGWSPPDVQARPGEAGPAERIRSEFPETWLWELEYTDASGRLTLDRAAPDSITSWDIRAIAMSPVHGLGIDETSVTVLQPLFLKADVPPRTIRNETIPIRVTAYNYTQVPQNVRVIIIAPPEMGLQGVTEQTVFVEGEGNALTTFHITPQGLGQFPIQIEARGETHADAMSVMTTVRAEGIPQENANNLILKAGTEETVQRVEPANAVQDTLITWVEISGGGLSKPLQNIGNMLKVPYGCGEQNMTVVGPNAQILRYLTQEGETAPRERTVSRATQLMQQGYQRQLTYQRDDGSFSAFGNSDSRGSIWLTAYTLKTFAQSEEFIHIDPTVMKQTVSWIEKQQNQDGSFNLHHRTVHSTELVDSDTALTAYIALALQEAGATAAAEKAVGFLEREISETMNAHTRAITSLVLARANSPLENKSLDILMDLNQADENGRIWRVGGKYVEPTAYAAMALHEAGRYREALMAVDTLLQRQSSLGGYNDSHSTAVAIEAIAITGDNQMDTETWAEITLETQGWSDTVVINRENRDIVQRMDPPKGTTPITIRTTGTVRAYVSIISQHNVLPKTKPQADGMELQVSLDRTELRVGESAKVTATIHYKDTSPGNPGMITAEIENPTGTSPSPGSLRKLVADESRVMRVDNQDGKTIIYIDWMGPGETMVLEYQTVAALPVDGRPASAQVYAYYRPEIRTSATLPQVRVTN